MQTVENMLLDLRRVSEGSDIHADLIVRWDNVLSVFRKHRKELDDALALYEITKKRTIVEFDNGTLSLINGGSRGSGVHGAKGELLFTGEHSDCIQYILKENL